MPSTTIRPTMSSTRANTPPSTSKPKSRLPRPPIGRAWSHHSDASSSPESPTFHTPRLDSSSNFEMTATPKKKTYTSRLKYQDRDTEAAKMEHNDSGYEEGNASASVSARSISRSTTASATRSSTTTSTCHRRCTSYTSTRIPSSTTAPSNNTKTRPTTRPIPKRSPRSSGSYQLQHQRTRSSILSSASRPTSPHNRETYTYFQFPSLSDPPDSSSSANATGLKTLNTQPEVSTPPLPPATTHYWTSEETRRLEYAAIDAATSGVRGFMMKLVPSCILPVEKRRRGFYEDADDDDTGSVRRYRLSLSVPQENEGQEKVDMKKMGGDGKEVNGESEGEEDGKTRAKRPSLLRRWTTFGGRGKKMA